MESMTDFAPEPTVLKTSEFVFDALVAGPKNGPLNLLLHGFPQFADAWAGVMRTIATGGYRAVAVNQRG